MLFIPDIQTGLLKKIPVGSFCVKPDVSVPVSFPRRRQIHEAFSVAPDQPFPVICRHTDLHVFEEKL